MINSFEILVKVRGGVKSRVFGILPKFIHDNILKQSISEKLDFGQPKHLIMRIRCPQG